MQTKRQAKFEFDEIHAIEDGPERRAKLEAWKAKYPDFRTKFAPNPKAASDKVNGNGDPAKDRDR